MNGPQALAAAFAGAQNWYSGTVADVTPEMAKEVPPGVVHPIGELAAHILHGQDGFVSMLTGKKSIWERDGYDTKLGIPFVFLQDHAVARALQTTPADLAEYATKVFAETQAYIATLTDADLDREIDVFGNKMPVGAALGGPAIGNIFAHVGEISALKGLHGAKGYPF